MNAMSYHVLFFAFLAVFLMARVGVASSPESPDTVDNHLLVAEDVHGRSVGYYIIKWWNWFYTQSPSPNHPGMDRSGQYCGVGQSGPVWFLAGSTSMDTDKVQRTCRVPSGKYLFVPLLQKGGWSSNVSCLEKIQNYTLDDQRVQEMEVLVDDVALENPIQYRFSSEGCFRLRGDFPLAQKYGHYPAYVVAYALILKPLPSGTHRLQFKVIYKDQDLRGGAPDFITHDVSYKLIIE